MSYDKIYLAGFSQGAIMVNYVLLNSRHKLGGYLAFSGYIFDHDLHYNQVILNLTDSQKEKINSKKDYHIIATHSFMMQFFIKMVLKLISLILGNIQILDYIVLEIYYMFFLNNLFFLM